MSSVTEYYTIDEPAKAEHKTRGSKFIGYAFPVVTAKDCKLMLSALHKEHPKATHHCYAYRLGIDGNNFRFNDDGEPSGSAGKPILGQIDSKGLTDILVIVIRYFGGKQLGIPGLITAYKTTASLVLQTAPILRKPVLNVLHLQFDYTSTNEVMQLVKKFDCTIEKQQIDLFCNMTIGVPQNYLQEVENKLKDLRGVKTGKQ